MSLIADPRAFACIRAFKVFGGGGGSSGTRHAVTSVRALGDNAPRHWYLQHFCFSIQHIMEQDRWSQALMPLGKMPQHWYLQHVCLSVHIFASLYNISTRTLCAVFSCENGVRKQALF